MTSYYMRIGTFEIARNTDLGISAFGVWRGGTTVSFSISLRGCPRLLTYRTQAAALAAFEVFTQDGADLWCVWPDGTECSLNEPRDLASLMTSKSDDYEIKHAYSYDAAHSPVFTKDTCHNDQFPDPSDIQQMRDDPSFTHRET